MDTAQFARMKRAFERRGGVIDQSAEVQRYLEARGATAATLNESTIILRSKPTVTEVFEEFIHTAQFRQGRMIGSNVLQMEIEAAEKLIRFRRAYGIANIETRQTIQRLRNLRSQLTLQRLLRGGG
jgi:hypothetical protein